MEKSCCFTGYRPEKFSFPLEFSEPRFTALENKIYDAVFAAVREGTETFYCGMAEGFDLLCGKAVVDIKRMSPNSNLKLIAAIPFEKQSEHFSPMWKKLYEIVLNEADERVVLRREYNIKCFSERNRYMVDNSVCVITFFDGQSGGTANTVRYAAKKGRNVKNIAEYDLSDIYNEYSAYQYEIE